MALNFCNGTFDILFLNFCFIAEIGFWMSQIGQNIGRNQLIPKAIDENDLSRGNINMMVRETPILVRAYQIRPNSGTMKCILK